MSIIIKWTFLVEIVLFTRHFFVVKLAILVVLLPENSKQSPTTLSRTQFLSLYLGEWTQLTFHMLLCDILGFTRLE